MYYFLLVAFVQMFNKGTHNDPRLWKSLRVIPVWASLNLPERNVVRARV